MDLKRCSRCEEEKPVNKFPLNSYKRKDGTVNKFPRSHCRDCVNKGNLHRYHNNPSTRDSHIKSSYKYMVKKYGLTVDEYEEMLKNQNHVCDICKGTTNRRLNIDHCHKTNKVRALLCHNCNAALGHTFEDIDRVNGLIDYIRRHNE